MQSSEQSNSLRKSFAGQVVSFGLAQLVIRLRGLIVLPILTRLIGTEGYGNLAPLGALGAITQTLIILGAANSLKIFIPNLPKERRSEEFWGVFQITLITGTTAVLLLAALFPLLRDSILSENTDFTLYLGALLAIPVSALQTILYAQVVNNSEGLPYARTVLISSLLETILLIVGALGFREVGVIYATALSQLVLTILVARLILRTNPFVWLRREMLQPIKKYYVYGLTLVVGGLASSVVASSDRFFLVRLASAEEAGAYDVIYNFSSQLNYLAAPIFSALMPFVAASVGRGETKRARSYLSQANKMVISIFVPAILLYSATSRDLFLVMTTPEFAAATSIVPIIALAVAFIQFVGVYNYNIHAHQRGQWIVFSVVVAAILNLSLNAIFIPRYGMLAAAWSTLAAYVLAFLLNRHFSNQSLKVGYDWIFVGKVVLSSLLMFGGAKLVITAMPLQSSLLRFLAASGVGGVVYLLSIWILRAYTEKERDYLKNVLRSIFVPGKKAKLSDLVEDQDGGQE